MLSPDMEATEASVLLHATCKPLTQPVPTAAGERQPLDTQSDREGERSDLPLAGLLL